MALFTMNLSPRRGTENVGLEIGESLFGQNRLNSGAIKPRIFHTIPYSFRN
jgi:hypothetical protein